jgi:hypothetical protein
MYNNTNTNNAITNSTNPQPQPSVILPHGWMQATDPASGRIYYCNPTSKETRWDPPPFASIQTPPLPLEVPSSQYQSVPVIPAPASVGAASIHSCFSSSHSHSHHSSADETGEGTNAHSTSQLSSSQHPEGLIVPVVRSLFDKVASLPNPAMALDLELDGLTAGEIADLCHIQQADTHGSNQAYLPLNPYTMPVSAKRPEVEHARLDVRIVELKEKLQRYGGYKS